MAILERKIDVQSLTNEEQKLVLSGLLHSFARNKEPQSPKILVVGVTQGSADAYVRDTLRAAEVPANILTLGYDNCPSKWSVLKSEAVDGWRAKHSDVSFVFMLEDVAHASNRTVDNIVRFLNTALYRTDHPSFLLNEAVYEQFFHSLFNAWSHTLSRTKVTSNINLSDQVEHIRLDIHYVIAKLVGTGEKFNYKTFENKTVVLDDNLAFLDKKHLTSAVSRFLRNAESILMTEKLAWLFFQQEMLGDVDFHIDRLTPHDGEEFEDTDI